MNKPLVGDQSSVISLAEASNIRVIIIVNKIRKV